jgi:hypothetical protein
MRHQAISFEFRSECKKIDLQVPVLPSENSACCFIQIQGCYADTYIRSMFNPVVLGEKLKFNLRQDRYLPGLDRELSPNQEKIKVFNGQHYLCCRAEI